MCSCHFKILKLATNTDAVKSAKQKNSARLLCNSIKLTTTLSSHCSTSLKPLITFLFIISLLWESPTYAAIDEILNDYYFQNPAELSLVNHSEWIIGNQFISPNFQFKGNSLGQAGSTTSKVNDSLPYVLTSYRFSDRLVLGVNIVPSGYGHFEWPIDSIVAEGASLILLDFIKIPPAESPRRRPCLLI